MIGHCKVIIRLNPAWFKTVLKSNLFNITAGPLSNRMQIVLFNDVHFQQQIGSVVPAPNSKLQSNIAKR